MDSVLRGKASFNYVLFQIDDIVFYVFGLIVEHESNEIKWRMTFKGAKIATFVDENAKFSHSLLQGEKRRGIIPAEGWTRVMSTSPGPYYSMLQPWADVGILIVAWISRILLTIHLLWRWQ